MKDNISSIDWIPFFRSSAVETIICSVLILLACTIPANCVYASSNEDHAVFFPSHESAGGIYSGPLKEFEYEGDGKFLYRDGSYYTGSFSGSKRNGLGDMYFANGDKFAGNWIDDQLQYGIYTFSNGDSFRGEFREGKFWNGTLQIKSKKNSVTFEFCYKDGVRSSDKYSTKGLKYDGNLTGYASIKYPSGNKYTGQVVDGKKHGQGKYEWCTNNVTTSMYVGEWNNDQMTGHGRYYYTGNMSYPFVIGNFEDGKIKGKAVYHESSRYSYDTLWNDGVCYEITERQEKK